MFKKDTIKLNFVVRLNQFKMMLFETHKKYEVFELFVKNRRSREEKLLFKSKIVSFESFLIFFTKFKTQTEKS